MSWWNRGEELGEHAAAGVVYAETVPIRVIDTTSFLALESASRVPNEPSAGVATVQSPVSLGHAPLAGAPAPFTAGWDGGGGAPSTPWPCVPRTSSPTGPVTTWRTLTGFGKPLWYSPRLRPPPT